MSRPDRPASHLPGCAVLPVYCPNVAARSEPSGISATIGGMIAAASLTDWLQAAGGIGGVGSAIAASVLAVLAYGQMKATRAQAIAANKQVDQMREDARTERRHRELEGTQRDKEQREREQAL